MNQDHIFDGYTDSGAMPSADPSERRLTVYLSATGVKAYLKNTVDPSVPYRVLINTKWNADETDTLRKIENCIYDHPEVLDDYECDVIVETDKGLWMPYSVAEDEDCRATAFHAVYAAEEEDIMMDATASSDDAPAMVYTLCAGLPAFLRRTFPGARVTAQHTKMYQRFAGRHTEDAALYADIRGDKMDILVFKGSELLLGATHRCADTDDAHYHIVNCITQAALELKSCEVFLSGDRQMRQTLISDLREEIAFVRNTMLPRIEAPQDMPTAALICASNLRHRPDELNTTKL